MRNPGDTYFSIKNGKSITPDDKAQIRSVFWGEIDSLNYHDLLSYGLVFRPDKQDLERARKLIVALIEREEEDLLKAILTTVCIYWNNIDAVIEEILCVIRLKDFDLFGDAIIVAARALASFTNKNKKQVYLEELKEIACRYLEDGAFFEAETYVEAVLYAATGDRNIRSSDIKFYLNAEILGNIDFNFEIKNCQIH